MDNSPITPENDQTWDEDTPQGAITPSGQVAKSLANLAVQSTAPELMEVTSEAKQD